MVKKQEREKINNFNPHNRIKLNKFHQEVGKKKVSETQQLKKKERDIERLIAHQKIDQGIKDQKIEELKKVRGNLEGHKKTFERGKRKEFFMETKYSGVKFVERKKITKMLNKVKQALQQNPGNKELEQQEEELIKKLRYVLHYPKTLKYVSLFPTTQLTQEATKFQEKIMSDIQQKHKKQQHFKNKYEQESTALQGKDKKLAKDSFFIM